MENRQQAESSAAAWIARRERDDWSASDEAELDAWIRATTDNRVAWLRLNAAWQQTNRLKSLTTSVPRGTVPAPDQISLPFYASGAEDKHVDPADAPTTVCAEDSSVRRTKAAFQALAASIVLAVAAALSWVFWPSGPSYHTEVGALQVVPLPEGSRVTLNTDSEIRLAVTEKERRVDLEHGEAFFEVAKDPERPFVVTAGTKRVIAVGTKFSVRRENDEIRVFVTEGKVRVEQDAERSSGATVRAGDEGGAILAAGSIARANDDSVLVQERSVADVEQLLTWRTGHLAFDKTPLADAVAEFNRYNKRKIVIQDPSVAAIRVGGNFRATNVDGFVRLIASDLPVTATQQGNEIILTGAPPP